MVFVYHDLNYPSEIQIGLFETMLSGLSLSILDFDIFSHIELVCNF